PQQQQFRFSSTGEAISSIKGFCLHWVSYGLCIPLVKDYRLPIVDNRESAEVAVPEGWNKVGEVRIVSRCVEAQRRLEGLSNCVDIRRATYG
ncbi:hypothetical protein V5O48_018620, partial [Marasmius crinis-equi]